MTEPSCLSEDLSALLDLLEATALAALLPQERWPLARLGTRDPIPPYIRWAVFERDGGICGACGVSLSIKTARLDHIVPWSAGGSDTSTNLRILCERCNSDRSNFRGWLDWWAAKRLPVAFWCSGCDHLDQHGTEVEDPCPVTEDMQFAYCAQCGLVSRTWTEACF